MYWFICISYILSCSLAYLYLHFPLFHLCPVTVQSVLYKLKGEQALLGPDTPSQPPPDSILWKCNGNKVVEFTGSEEKAYGSYEGRVTLDWHTAQLHISDLRLEDSGSYEYEIAMPGKVLRSSYELEVIGKSLIVWHSSTACIFYSSKICSPSSAELLSCCSSTSSLSHWYVF